MVKRGAAAGREQRLLPVNLPALSPAQGAVTGQGRGGRASR